MDFNESVTTVLPDLPGLITYEVRQAVEDVISCGLLPVIFLVGLFGNIVSLVVLSYLGSRETTNIILIGLTVTDLLYILASLALDMKCIVGRINPLWAVNVEAVTRACLLVPVFLLGRVSALYICLIAVERYIAVLHPLKAAVLLSRKRVMAACVSLYFIGFAPSLCLFFVFDLENGFSPEFNATIKIVKFTKFFLDNFDFMNYYSNFFLAVVFRWIPVGLISFCTGSILRSLSQQRLERNTLTSGPVNARKDAEQRRMTKTLLSICILFIICIVPNIILEIARILFAKMGFNDVGRYSNISAVVLSFVNLCAMVNSSVNFILYIMTSRKFAAVVWKIFLPGWMHGQQTGTSVSGLERMTETEAVR